MALLFVVGTALCLRYQWAISHPLAHLGADAAEYDRLARNLLHGHGYSKDGHTPFTRRVPAYPLFLAAVYAVFGHSLKAVSLIQAGLGAATAGLTYLIGRRMCGDWAGLLGALLYAIYAPANSLFARILSEAIYIPVLALVVLLLIYALEERALWRFVLIGVLTGVAALARPVAIGFPLFAVAGIFVRQGFTRRSLLAALVVSASFGVVISAWLTHNYVQLDGQIIFVSQVGRRAVGAMSGDSIQAIAGSDQGLGLGVIAGIILSDPLEYLRAGFAKIGVLYSPPRGVWRWVGIGQLALGLIGMGALLPRWRAALAAYMVISYTTLFHFLSSAVPRYALSIAPYWFLFAAAGVIFLVSWVLARLKRRVAESPS